MKVKGGKQRQKRKGSPEQDGQLRPRLRREPGGDNETHAGDKAEL